MSSSDSDNENENINHWPWQCTCGCDESDSSDDSYYSEDNESTSDEFSDKSDDEKEIILISVFNQQGLKNINLISDAKEIKNYRKKYEQLPQKNVKSIMDIWADVKIDMPNCKETSLKPILLFENILNSNLKGDKINVAKNKLPQHMVKLVNEKLSKAEIKKQSNLKTQTCLGIQKKTTQTESKESNSTTQNKTESKQNNILQKPIKTVIDKSQAAKDTSKPNIVKCIETNSKIPDTKAKENITLNKVEKNTFNTNNSDKKDLKKQITNSSSNKEIKIKTSVTLPTSKKILKEHEIVKINSKDKMTENDIVDNKIKSDETILFKKPDFMKIVELSNSKNDIIIKDVLHSKLNSHNKLDITEKLLKKREKKKRQKEKKLEARRDASNSSSRDVSEASSINSNKSTSSINISNKNVNAEINESEKNKTIESKKEKIGKNKLVTSKQSDKDIDESDIEVVNTSDDDFDLLTDTENMPTFIADILKRKKKNNKQTKPKQLTETPTKNIEKKEKNEVKEKIENEQAFSINTRKRKAPSTPRSTPLNNYIIYSERFAEEAVDMILENNLIGGLEYISEAIDYNPDYRHYLNRSYCLLRMKKHALALTDAQYVVQMCTNTNVSTNINVYRFIANLRAGQASYALKKYKEAEYFLKEAIHINPESYHAQRELIRVKISHIMSLGFEEKDALLALQKYSSVKDAINYLMECNKNSRISKINDNFEIYENHYDDMIFSSDEENESSNFKTLNKMLNYNPGKIKFQHLIPKATNAELGYNTYEKNNKLKVTPDAKNKLLLTSKIANDKAIWVGSLTNDITEEMLRKKFKTFGKVMSVYRPCNEAYAFINFEKCEDVTNALSNISSHEIAGVKLSVRSAVRQK